MSVVTTAPMWLVYEDESGIRHYQHYTNLTEAGTLIDPDTGDDMAIIGWTAAALADEKQETM